MRRLKSKKSKIVEVVEIETVEKSEDEINALQRVENCPLRQILLTGTFIKFPKTIYRVPDLIESEI